MRQDLICSYTRDGCGFLGMVSPYAFSRVYFFFVTKPL